MFFSDAVFAIVITLLVLPLTTEIHVPRNADVAGQVVELWPQMVTFVVSFLVIGQFWLAHHRLFDRLQRYDSGLLWLNILCLLTVAFMPFPAALLGVHDNPDERFPVVFYAVSLSITSASLTLMWLYAVRRGLTLDDLDPRLLTGVTIRAATTTTVFFLSIAVAFLGLPAAIVTWVAILPAIRRTVSRRYGAHPSPASGSPG